MLCYVNINQDLIKHLEALKLNLRSNLSCFSVLLTSHFATSYVHSSLGTLSRSLALGGGGGGENPSRHHRRVFPATTAECQQPRERAQARCIPNNSAPTTSNVSPKYVKR